MSYEYYTYSSTIYRADRTCCILEYYYNNKWHKSRFTTENMVRLRGHEKDKEDLFLELL